MLLGMRSPKVGPTPVGAWRASTSTLAQLAALATHSRTSLATMFDSTGKLTYAPNNLLTQSNTFSNAAWTKSNITVASGVTDPLGGTNAFTLTATGVSAEIYQSVTGNTATNYVVSIWVRRRTGSGSVNLYKPDDGSYTAIGPSLTSNWQQFSTNGPGGASTAILDFVIQTSGDAVDVYLATVSAVTYETTARTADQVITTSSAYYGPRIDYDPNTLAVKGLLIEPVAATNYCPYSSALSSWTVNVGTVTNNSGATLDPSGLNTSTLINPTGGGATNLVSPTFAASASTQYTVSGFVKSAGSSFAAISLYDSTNAVLYVAIFNLSTGANTFATAGMTALQSENVGNGWWRFSATWTTAASTANMAAIFYPYSSGVGANPLAADKIYVWGPQVEKNFEASSYIANQSTGTTTRAPDNMQFAGAAAIALSSANFSAIVEGRIKTANASGIMLIGGTSAFGVHLYSVSNTTARAYDGTRAQVYGDVTSGGAAWSAGSRAGVAASPAGTSLVMAGGTVSNYTNFATQSSGAGLGRSVSSANPGTLWVKSFAIYNQRLPDATLQAKSVVGASF